MMEFLAYLFLKIFNMSIAASWLILAVLFLRLLLKKAPRWVHMLLWGLVALRLVCPFSIESALSLIPSGETVSPDIMMDAAPTVQTGIPTVNRIVNPVISKTFAPSPWASANPLQIWIPVLAVFWLAGMTVLLAYTAVSYWSLRRRVSCGVLLSENIFQSERVCSPFVLGMARPRIYLPFGLDRKQQEHVIAHEKAHIRRRDHWWKPMGFFLLTIHWFNPLLWLAYVLLCRDIELACDERVIRGLDNDQRADYTQALLSFSVNRRRIAACPLAFGEVGIKKRVKSVMNYKKPALGILMVSALACALAAVCFLTDPKGDCFEIQIVIPAGSREAFVYSQEEISPTGDSIIISSGDHLGDTEVALKPVEVKEENAYDEPAYLTPGMPVKMKAEKDGWFRIGVSNMQDPSGEDITVSVKVEKVRVRISSRSGSALQWFDYTKDPSKMDWDRELTFENPAFPGVTFRYTPEQISVTGPSEEDGQEPYPLIAGMPIWNAYFCDLTGDGLPELCASLSMGSGMIDNRIIIFDYRNGASYELEDRGNFDYYLRVNEGDGCLYVDKRQYGSDRLVSTGRLVYEDQCIQIEE